MFFFSAYPLYLSHSIYQLCAMIIIRIFEQGRDGRMAQVCGQNYEEKKRRGELRGTMMESLRQSGAGYGAGT